MGVLFERVHHFPLFRVTKLSSAYGTEDYSQWPTKGSLRNDPIKGKECVIDNILGRVSSAGLFVPDKIKYEERFDTWDITSDEMLALAMA